MVVKDPATGLTGIKDMLLQGIILTYNKKSIYWPTHHTQVNDESNKFLINCGGDIQVTSDATIIS